MINFDKSEIRRRANSAPCFLENRNYILNTVATGEEYRCDPNYYVFYSSQKPKDPRLPPPLFKSHFPGYFQLPIRRSIPQELLIPPFRHSQTSGNIMNSDLTGKYMARQTSQNCSQGRSADTNDLISRYTQGTLSDSSYHHDGSVDQKPRIQGGALLAFHISYALKNSSKGTVKSPKSEEGEYDDAATATTSSTISYRRNNDNHNILAKAGFPAPKISSMSVSEEHVTKSTTEDEDVNSSTCDTADALSLVSTQDGKILRSITSNPLPPYVQSPLEEVIRLPPILTPLIPRVFSGKVSFLFQPITRYAGTVQCSVYRDKKLTGTRYTLMLEVPPNPHVVVDSRGMEYIDCNLDRSTEVFLCAAKRSRTRSSTYILSAEMDDFDKKSINYIAKLRKNVTDNDYTLLMKTDVGTSHIATSNVSDNSAENDNSARGHQRTQQARTELLAIAFSPGTRTQPPQVQVVFPSSEGITSSSNGAAKPNPSANTSSTITTTISSTATNSSTASTNTTSARAGNQEWLLQKFKNGLCNHHLILRNTVPVWNPNSKLFEVDFGKRVTKSTTKNLQLEYVDNATINSSTTASSSSTTKPPNSPLLSPSSTKRKRILLTFGKVEDNRFVLDFVNPISPIQAFSVALSALDFL